MKKKIYVVFISREKKQTLNGGKTTRKRLLKKEKNIMHLTGKMAH